MHLTGGDIHSVPKSEPSSDKKRHAKQHVFFLRTIKQTSDNVISRTL